jgi:hypothetical protein
MHMHSSTAAAQHLQLSAGTTWPGNSSNSSSSISSQAQPPAEQPPVVPQPQQQQRLLQLLQQQCGGWWEQHAEVAGPLLKGVLSPPLLAGIVAILIGSCPPLQVSKVVAVAAVAVAAVAVAGLSKLPTTAGLF